MMTGRRLRGPAQDRSGSNGLREPRHHAAPRNGSILDGRNRKRVCDELGRRVRTKLFKGPDSEALAYVEDMNLRRRHLSEGQRAMFAARVAKLGRDRRSNAAPAAFTQGDAARKYDVSPDSIQRARIVLAHAAPEIIAAVDQGVMAVAVAAGIAKQPPERQLARLARDQRKAGGTHRPDDDYYRTPPPCTHGLLAAECFERVLLEPACGDGAISRVLEAAGYTVISSDLIDRGYGEGGRNFLQERKRRADAAITNPPYELADEFALHLIELGVKKFALMCRLAWLEGQDRPHQLWRQGKLARVWVFSPRQTLWRGDDDAAEDDGGMTAYA